MSGFFDRLAARQLGVFDGLVAEVFAPGGHWADRPLNTS